MEIHVLAKNNDVEGVARELEKGVPVDIHDNNEFTPLAYAACGEDVELNMLQVLVDAGADVNATVNSKDSVLCLGMQSGKLEKVQFLLDSGANVNFKSPKGYTPLINVMYSQYDGSQLLQMVQLLLSHGAETDCRTEYGESPLSVASSQGRYDVVRVLLNSGADPSPLQWTPLMRAVALGGHQEVSDAIQSGEEFEARDRWGRTPFMLAVISGDSEKARLLLKQGCDINAMDGSGDSPLTQCAFHGDDQLLTWLIQHGAEIDSVNTMGQSVLMCAANAGHEECVRRLIDAGADTAYQNEYNDNVMSVAGSEAVVRLLVEAGEDFNDLSSEMKRTLVGLETAKELLISRQNYLNGRNRRFGQMNPEIMDVPFWREMVRCGFHAYTARKQFGDEGDSADPVWCFSRYGMSFTKLPDGRFVQIGGEHEDFYDPDFCIYNDVVVHEQSGSFQIFGYPKHVFPPTDFHSANYFDSGIYLVGGLGYSGERRFGETPVYRLDCNNWRIETVTAKGQNPGWIYNHKGRLIGDKLHVSNGEVCVEVEGREQNLANDREFVLDLNSFVWSCQ